MHIQAFWAALLGFALGSAQSLTVDWLRDRRWHRSQLRLLRSELRRLARFDHKWNLEHGIVPPTDETPIPPSITSSFEKLIHEIDFWLTDEHDDDNTQQGLIDIVDGARLLERYDATVRALLDAGFATPDQVQRTKKLHRGVETAKVYDLELDRWRTMVGSASIDAGRRLRIAGLWKQLGRVLLSPRPGTNPPPVPAIRHPPSEV